MRSETVSAAPHVAPRVIVFWSMPEWMEPYRERIFCIYHVEDAMNGCHGNSIQLAVAVQIEQLEWLREMGMLNQ